MIDMSMHAHKRGKPGKNQDECCMCKEANDKNTFRKYDRTRKITHAGELDHDYRLHVFIGSNFFFFLGWL